MRRQPKAVHPWKPDYDALLLLFAAVLTLAATLPNVLADEDAKAGMIETTEYSVSPSRIELKSYLGAFKVAFLEISNKRLSPVDIVIVTQGPITELLSIGNGSATIGGDSSQRINLTFFTSTAGEFNGTVKILGGIAEDIPVLIKVSNSSLLAEELLALSIDSIEPKISLKEQFKAVIYLENLLSGKSLNVALSYFIQHDQGRKITNASNLSQPDIFTKEHLLAAENITLNTSLSLLKAFDTSEAPVGDYFFGVKAEYADSTLTSTTRFRITAPFYEKKLLGIIAVKYLAFALAAGIIISGGLFFYKKQQAKKKRYVSKLYLDQLPKPGARSLPIGKIAETSRQAYFDMDQLAMHTLIAGSTGGGKTVSAEVLVEEALIHGASVIVFDPTAQWTGFLRKNTDKKMFAIYPLYGMKPTDARSFSGNVRQIMNAREVVDIRKYMNPGEITCFAINRLDPEDIDIVVANTVRQVFKANLPDSQGLKLMIIFDEVHRLLPKFGGSGQGFLQIERAAREFRKWGVGLMLISQVLTDFASEVKANIATEIQMRTRDQGDLDRIKTKYGDYMLQSLLKAATGTGMIENPAYNKGDPFFVSFKPLMHNHAALSDEELANYNKYNAIIDEVENHLDQLKAEGVDIFDLQLELKLAKDKLKLGNFNMVDIYVEGIQPKVAGEWKKIGKQPKKYEAQLLSEEEMKKEYETAVKARQKLLEEQEKKGAKKEDQKEKAEFKPLRLKTGLVVMNTQELQEAFQTMSEDAFKFHVNETKNDFADWAQPVDPVLSNKLRKAKTKDEALKAIEEGSSAKPDSKKAAGNAKK